MNNAGQEEKNGASRHRGRRYLRWLGRIAGAVVVLLLVGAVFESRAEASAASMYPPPGQLVDVGGYRLHINCTGEGSPTVVIEAGLGDWSTSWGLVQPEVAKTTRVCTYDRAGMGWSERGPLPRDARRMAKELNTLLQNAKIPGPYIMVGHSLGGLPVRVFVHDHPSEVVGVVLIESMQPEQSTYAKQSGMLSFFSVLARFGIARLIAKPLGLTSSDGPNADASFSRSVRPQSLQTFADEIRSLPDSLAQAGTVKSFGDLPLLVLSRGLDKDADWEAGQAGLTQLSPNSQQLTAAKSDHLVQLHQPDAAVAAIVQMVHQVRGQ